MSKGDPHMKLTKSHLKQIIKEEIELYEAEGEEVLAALEDVPAEARDMAVKIKREIEKMAGDRIDPEVLAQAVAALVAAD